jgi:hypothetical protein
MLEHQKIYEIKDGREDFRIRLLLGPFSYVMSVKERRPDKVEVSNNEE